METSADGCLMDNRTMPKQHPLCLSAGDNKAEAKKKEQSSKHNTKISPGMRRLPNKTKSMKKCIKLLLYTGSNQISGSNMCIGCKESYIT